MTRWPERPAALVVVGLFVYGACTPPGTPEGPATTPAAATATSAPSADATAGAPPVVEASGPAARRWLPLVGQAGRAEAPATATAAVAAATPAVEAYPAPWTGDPAPQLSPPAPCAGIARREGDALVLDGQPVVFFGINAHYLLDAELPEATAADLLAALAARGVNTVRVWFFAPHDPERFARLLDLGRTLGLRYVVVLGDNVFKGRDWFFGRDDERNYRPHLERTVARFADRPEILAWEVINEPNCGDGGYDEDCLKTIKDWVTMASRMIEALDACHPVSSGMIGDGNFEVEHEAYRQIHKRGSIDLVSVHKRTADEVEGELELAEDIERPIYYGEVYDRAYDTGCEPLAGGAELERRAGRVADDLAGAVGDGVDGYLLWDLAAGLVAQTNGRPRDYCGEFGYTLDDPVWARLAAAGLPPKVPWAR